MSILAVAGALQAAVSIARAFVDNKAVLDVADNAIELGINLATFAPKFREIIAASPDAAPELLAEAKALSARMDADFEAALADLGQRAPNS